MEHEIKYDRPLTVSGLIAKHKELTMLCDKYRAEIKKLTVDIDHLDAAIRLFDPNAETYAMKAFARTTRIPKGKLKYFLLSTLREAPAPMTSRQLAILWAHECGLDQSDQAINETRKKITACIKENARQGLIESVGQTTDHGANGPYKLWMIKKAK
tara:strand:+ start:1316 stop:1783 length:468 start_codon:yes stop_codon:yes gene_type:complete